MIRVIRRAFDSFRFAANLPRYRVALPLSLLAEVSETATEWELRPDVLEWLEQTVPGRWMSIGRLTLLGFKHEPDMVAFRLMYSEELRRVRPGIRPPRPWPSAYANALRQSSGIVDETS